MRNFLCAAAIVLAAVPAVAAEPQFSADRLKADVGFMADDLLEGRDTGSRGHEIAAAFVAAEFAKAGLQPAGKNGWFTPLTFPAARLASGKVTITGGGAPADFAHAGETIVYPLLAHPTGDVTAPLVFVGFGIDAPKQGFDDYKGLDVRGKIVVMLNGIPNGPPNEVLAHLARQKSAMAVARGAVGVISVNTLRGTRQYGWTRRLETANAPDLTWVQSDGKPFDDGAALRGRAMASPAAAERIFAGAKQPLAAVLALADTMGGRPRGFALATTARIESRSTESRITSPQVVGRLPGSDPALAAEHVVLMAHLDHIGISADKKGDKINNGALDNAAGVAVMLEVARAFQASGAPKRSMLFLANTAEEKGLLGAEGFAADPGIPAEKIIAAVDLDMPLLLYNFTDVIAFGGDHTTMGPVIADAVKSAGVSLSSDPMPAETIFVRSDHYAFVKRGVPAIMLATGFGNGGDKIWENFLKTDYHQPSDDMKLPIDWAAGAKFARVNYLIARQIADGAERPRWYQGDYFGATFAPGAPKAPRSGGK
ncbi:MAG: peptidase M28 [Alphaproteobacteria bacterium]|nr:MAG: peptidase M28 [Alphaproteobacteria bacterium]